MAIPPGLRGRLTSPLMRFCLAALLLCPISVMAAPPAVNLVFANPSGGQQIPGEVSICYDGVSALVVCSSPGAGGGQPITTYQGTITLAAATSTALTSGNVTMSPNSAALPAAGSFVRLVVIVPAACSVTVNWFGGTATATSGEQMGAGTNVGTDTVNLTGVSAAPTLFSTAGCTNIQFRN